MSGIFLTLNAGSSSIKFSVYPSDFTHPDPILKGKIEGIGRAPTFSATANNDRQLDKGPLTSLNASDTHKDVLALLLPWLTQQLDNRPLHRVAHRVVHGGTLYADPTLITDAVLSDLTKLTPLAPLHQPHNLAAIIAISQKYPDVPQIACFDTGFHRTQDRLEELYAIPRALSDEGIQKFGFHGLSYDYISTALPDYLADKADGRVVVAHLGNGSSMCAMKNRQSIATSMGFTALDGLVMGRRSGAIDPGVILYLMQSKGMTAAEIETLLYRESGLLGVSGISNNMQVLQQSDSPNAAEAINLYCHRAASVLSGFLPALGGLDAIVFTAGIGENSAAVRAKICAKLAWLGVDIAPNQNTANATRISTDNSKIDVLVLPTNEELVMARACQTTQK